MLSLHARKVKDEMFKGENPVWRQIIERAGAVLSDGQHRDVRPAHLVFRVLRLATTTLHFYGSGYLTYRPRSLWTILLYLRIFFLFCFGCELWEFPIEVSNFYVSWSLKLWMRDALVCHSYALWTRFFYYYQGQKIKSNLILASQYPFLYYWHFIIRSKLRDETRCTARRQLPP